MAPTEKKDQDADLIVTGPYIHKPGNFSFISFETEGETPRSFSVLVAEGMIVDGKTYPANGIAVLDTDNVRIVADRIYEQDITGQGPSREQMTAFGFIKALGWREFSYFCKTRETFRGDIPDIASGQSIPNEGNREMQIRVNALDPAFVDNRSDFVRSLHASPELPYSFPRATRGSMISEILGHEAFYGRDGAPSALAWDVRMNFQWNKSGRISQFTNGECDGEDVDVEFDEKWLKTLRRDTTIFERACDTCIKPFVAESFSPFEMEEISVDLRLSGSNDGFVTLHSFNGQDMTFRSHDELKARVEALDDESILHLWVTCRTLDTDLSREARGLDMALHLNKIRAELEQEWNLDLDDEVRFDEGEEISL